VRACLPVSDRRRMRPVRDDHAETATVTHCTRARPGPRRDDAGLGGSAAAVACRISERLAARRSDSQSSTGRRIFDSDCRFGFVVQVYGRASDLRAAAARGPGVRLKHRGGGVASPATEPAGPGGPAEVRLAAGAWRGVAALIEVSSSSPRGLATARGGEHARGASFRHALVSPPTGQILVEYRSNATLAHASGVNQV
jgi:hypothetical protein